MSEQVPEGAVAERLQRAIEENDIPTIARIALRAVVESMKGNYCQCSEPALFGRDLMCGICGLENMGQRERREAEMRAPHTFEPMSPDGIKSRMCKICSGWTDNPRHVGVAP